MLTHVGDIQRDQLVLDRLELGLMRFQLMLQLAEFADVKEVLRRHLLGLR